VLFPHPDGRPTDPDKSRARLCRWSFDLAGNTDRFTQTWLDDLTGDDEYLALLAGSLPRVIAAARPELVVYLAGADPHENDKLGRLSLSFEALARRDSMVIEQCREVGIPVVVAIAGGYGNDMLDTVRVHVNTARIAARYA